MSKTTKERIEEIVNKIDKILSEKLDQSGAQKFLGVIYKDLGEVKKNAGEKDKEIVDKKLEELKNKIDEGFEEEWGWGMTKNALKDIRSELSKLEDEIGNALTLVISHNVLTRGQGTDLEELTKWRELFNGMTPEEAAKGLNNLAKGWAENQKGLMELQATFKETAKSGKNVSILEVGNAVSDVAYRFEKLGHEIGKDSLPLFGTMIGGILGGGGGIIAGGAQYGAHFADKGLNMVDDTRKDLKDHVEHHADNMLDAYKETREGAENVTVKVIENIGETTKSFLSIFGAGSLEKEVEILKKQLEEKKTEIQTLKDENKQEMEKKDKFFEKQLEEKKTEIKELKGRIEKLENDLKEQSNKLFAHVEESRASSPMPPFSNQ